MCQCIANCHVSLLQFKIKRSKVKVTGNKIFSYNMRQKATANAGRVVILEKIKDIDFI